MSCYYKVIKSHYLFFFLYAFMPKKCYIYRHKGVVISYNSYKFFFEAKQSTSSESECECD